MIFLVGRAEGGGALDGDLALDHAGEDAEFDDVGGVLVEEFGDFGAWAATEGERFAEEGGGWRAGRPWA